MHGHPLVYLDSAASSQRPRAVLRAIEDYETHSHANVHRGVHALSQAATAAFEGARERVRRFVNAASVREVVFVRGTTEAINLVAQSCGRSRLRPGDEILITALEHHANIVPWQMVCEQTGAMLKVAPINRRGELEFDEYLKLLSPRTRLVGHRSRLQCPGHGAAGEAHGRRPPMPRGPWCWSMAPRPCPTSRSTCRPSARTSMPSPGTSSTDRPASACSTPARHCSRRCRPGRAAAT